MATIARPLEPEISLRDGLFDPGAAPQELSDAIEVSAEMPIRRWPNAVVPFKFDPAFTKNHKAEIRATIYGHSTFWGCGGDMCPGWDAADVIRFVDCEFSDCSDYDRYVYLIPSGTDNKTRGNRGYKDLRSEALADDCDLYSNPLKGTNWDSASQGASPFCHREASTLHVADTNGDGLSDLVCHDETWGMVEIMHADVEIDWIDGKGLHERDTHHDLNFCNAEDGRLLIAAFDDEDERADLLCQNRRTGHKAILFAHPDGTSALPEWGGSRDTWGWAQYKTHVRLPLP